MSKKPRFLVRLASMLCAFALVLGGMPQAVRAETNKEKLARLKNELASLTASIEEQEKTITNTEALIKEYVAEQALILEYLEANKESIEATQQVIELQQAEIAQKRQTIIENQELFESRLVAIYKMNNAGLLSTLLSVTSYSDLLSVSTNLQTISKHDTELLDTLAREKADLEEELARLDESLAELQERYDELEALSNTYAANIAKQRKTLSAAEAALEANKEIYGYTYEEYQQAYAAEKATQNQLANSGSNSNDGSKYEGGQFTWPTPGYYTVTCEYGQGDPNGTPHRGMDISGGGGSGAIAGANIVATASGTVLTAATNHYSYGQYIVIDHSGGLKTLYAHCSALYVSAGQYVEAGTPIGAVGSSGFSTGAHLHLEVHQDGVLQNPRNYFG